MLEPMIAKAKAAGISARGIADHKSIDSIYFRDPNGYVIELTAKRPDHDDQLTAAKAVARANLDTFQLECGDDHAAVAPARRCEHEHPLRVESARSVRQPRQPSCLEHDLRDSRHDRPARDCGCESRGRPARLSP